MPSVRFGGFIYVGIMTNDLPYTEFKQNTDIRPILFYKGINQIDYNIGPQSRIVEFSSQNVQNQGFVVY